jgi:hypothetical protein
MNTAQKTMTEDEIYALCLAFLKASKDGDHDERQRILNIIPMHPRIAKTVKSFYEPKYLLDNGFDLSKVYEEFGEDWLEQ